jgi:hypothetical protein
MTMAKARIPGTKRVRASTSWCSGTVSLALVAPKMSRTPRGIAKVKNADSGLRQKDFWLSRIWCRRS